MQRRRLGAIASAIAWMVLATPVAAHGDHDARPLARDLDAGPYGISLWQVYPDAGTAMTPHLIVLFDEGAPEAAVVTVAVNGTLVAVRPSTTTADGWETSEGVAEGDLVAVRIADGTLAWDLDVVVVPPPATSMLPMAELIYLSIFLTGATALWVAGRTTRAWRRPAVPAN
ncbi:MAG TPA: hypothetical protein VF119_00725 [Candidatus Limnocylindrales bacterium]